MTREAEGFGARELTEKINKFLHEGNVRRIVVRTDKGRKVLDLPLTIGIVAVVVWPMIAAASAAVALAGGWKLEVEHTEPEEVDQPSEED
ncbi:DUF4342 domain-containing protein [Actinophytocola sp.]|uniref:DUF4342 domain-containing protein n=1 Tax=Actinophytocola sp. TaxID=1872138 RepID=UPI0025C72C77|nr:DUF4342 domain-containing protein [Actinophytocola sp.]